MGGTTRREWLRSAASPFALGALSVLGLRGCPVGASRGDVALWAADFAYDSVWGLNADGYLIARVPFVRPARLDWSDGRVTARRDERSIHVPDGVPPSDVVETSRLAGDLGLWVLRRRSGAPDPRHERVDLRPSRARSWLERWAPGRSSPWRLVHRFELPWPARAIVAGVHAERTGVWVAAERRNDVRFVTSAGVTSLRVRPVDLHGVGALARASARSGGGVWAASGGAIARWDSRGRRLPGQGGLGHVVALLATHEARLATHEPPTGQGHASAT